VAPLGAFVKGKKIELVVSAPQERGEREPSVIHDSLEPQPASVIGKKSRGFYSFGPRSEDRVQALANCA